MLAALHADARSSLFHVRTFHQYLVVFASAGPAYVTPYCCAEATLPLSHSVPWLEVMAPSSAATMIWYAVWASARALSFTTQANRGA